LAEVKQVGLLDRKENPLSRKIEKKMKKLLRSAASTEVRELVPKLQTYAGALVTLNKENPAIKKMADHMKDKLDQFKD
jgi:hypothetical protein